MRRSSHHFFAPTSGVVHSTAWRTPPLSVVITIAQAAGGETRETAGWWVAIRSTPLSTARALLTPSPPARGRGPSSNAPRASIGRRWILLLSAAAESHLGSVQLCGSIPTDSLLCSELLARGRVQTAKILGHGLAKAARTS